MWQLVGRSSEAYCADHPRFGGIRCAIAPYGLSGTAHWMFDRGLIGITDDHEILISRHVNDTAGVQAMINKTRRIRTPVRAVDQPHPHFLRWHRENCFKA